MILIADAGSTKIDWCVVTPDCQARAFSSEGVNALMLDEEHLHSAFSRALNSVTEAPGAVYYYGAGCVGGDVNRKVECAIRRVLRPADDAPVGVYSDLLGAARSLFGTEPGLACILGTGSNTGLYDGIGMAEQVPSLGYILGDEGGGAAIGRRLIRAAYRRRLPQHLREDMEAFLGMDYGGVIRRVYSCPGANSFLASVVPFVLENIGHESVYSIVADEFKQFFKNVIAVYGSVCHSVPIRFVGGVAVAFSDILMRTASDMGFETVDKIVARPIPGLLDYHLKNG